MYPATNARPSDASLGRAERAERRAEIGARVARLLLDLLIIAAVGFVLWWTLSMIL